VDGAGYGRLLRRSRHELVLLSILFAASPRNDVAYDWRFGVGGCSDWRFGYGGCYDWRFGFGGVPSKQLVCKNVLVSTVIARLHG
jgi:hypothetical protein